MEVTPPSGRRCSLRPKLAKSWRPSTTKLLLLTRWNCLETSHKVKLPWKFVPIIILGSHICSGMHKDFQELHVNEKECSQIVFLLQSNHWGSQEKGRCGKHPPYLFSTPSIPEHFSKNFLNTMSQAKKNADAVKKAKEKSAKLAGSSRYFLSDPGLLVRSMCLVLWNWVPSVNLTDSGW